MKQDESLCQVRMDRKDALVYLTFHFVTVALDYPQVCRLVGQLQRLGAMIAPLKAKLP